MARQRPEVRRRPFCLANLSRDANLLELPATSIESVSPHVRYRAGQTSVQALSQRKFLSSPARAENNVDAPSQFSPILFSRAALVSNDHGQRQAFLS